MSDGVIAALIGAVATILAAIVSAIIAKRSTLPTDTPQALRSVRASPVRRANVNRNVLLMLASDQPPPPQEEVRWHADQCRAHGSTHLVTTCVLTDLVSGESVVAFFGNADLGNLYLGQGVYLDYVRLDSPEGRQLLQASPLYVSRGIPDGAKGFIHLREVREAQDGEGLESLGGVITSKGASDGLPLRLDNLPVGSARKQVYYRRVGSGGNA